MLSLKHVPTQVFFPKDFESMTHTHEIGNFSGFVKNWGKIHDLNFADNK
jgi:hypothetical protein